MNNLRAIAFIALIAVILQQTRRYDELAEAYAGVHAGLLETQRRLDCYRRERARLMAYGLAATSGAQIEFSPN